MYLLPEMNNDSRSVALTHCYHFIFVLNVLLLLFLRFRVVQLDKEEVNPSSDCSTHHWTGNWDPPPAATSTEIRDMQYEQKLVRFYSIYTYNHFTSAYIQYVGVYL